MNQDQNEQEQLLRQIEVLEQTAKQHLSGEAITRYGNLKAAHPQRAMQVLVILNQLIQAGHVKHILSDKEFKDILIQTQQPQKEFKVKK